MKSRVYQLETNNFTDLIIIPRIYCFKSVGILLSAVPHMTWFGQAAHVHTKKHVTVIFMLFSPVSNYWSKAVGQQTN